MDLLSRKRGLGGTARVAEGVAEAGQFSGVKCGGYRLSGSNFDCLTLKIIFALYAESSDNEFQNQARLSAKNFDTCFHCFNPYP